MKLGAAGLTFRYADSFDVTHGLKAYDRLILDAMLGNYSLFTKASTVERLWEISAPLLDNPPPLQSYSPGSWGPQPAINQLAAPCSWHLPDAGSRT